MTSMRELDASVSPDSYGREEQGTVDDGPSKGGTQSIELRKCQSRVIFEKAMGMGLI